MSVLKYLTDQYGQEKTWGFYRFLKESFRKLTLNKALASSGFPWIIAMTARLLLASVWLAFSDRLNLQHNEATSRLPVAKATCPKLYHTSANRFSLANIKAFSKHGITKSNCWQFKQQRPILLNISAVWIPICSKRLGTCIVLITCLN